MELRFVAPRLTSLDELDAEILACSIWSDVRPCQGLAGLCDWRMAGRISRLQAAGHVTGELGEVVLLPAKPKLRFDKLLLLGAGPRTAFDEAAFEQVLARLLAAADGLCARSPTVELPGRQDGVIAPERAADLLLAAAGRDRDQETWTLVEGSEARQRITEHMVEQRRRVRRTL